MTIRYALSRLSRPDARRVFGRTWLGVCLTGACATLLAVGFRHLFFVAAVWLVCIFAPVRIAIEALHVLGPRIRARMYRDLSGRRDRYTTREGIALMVEAHFGREVHMPRLAPPVLEAKVVEAAARLCGRAFLGGAGPAGVDRTATTCAGLLGRWVGTIADSERGAAPVSPRPMGEAAGRDGDGTPPRALWDPGASIQDQWQTLRAVAGLAALTKVLVAVAEDSAPHPLEGGSAMRSAAEAAMDYADQVGLRLEGPPWEDAAGLPAPALSPSVIGRLAGAWTVFCTVPQPAPRRLAAFVDALPE